MSKGTIHRLVETFMKVSESLGVHCTCKDAENLAVMVFRIMSYQSRQFHTLEHVFGFLDDDADPNLALSAIFHDLVYYQVDDGFQPELAGVVSKFVDQTEQGVHIRTDIPADNVLFHATLHLFGFKEGQVLLPFTGLNEFLSALVFVDLLDGHLDAREIMAVVACIEGSIPFRKPGAEGILPFDRLYLRLRDLIDRGMLKASDMDIRSMVDRAVLFANKDVKDFCNPDPGIFLSNTWKLLPELNSPLRKNGSFTIGEYRMALVKMRKFFAMLDPAWIFHSFDGKPNADRMEKYHQAATRNLAIAISYLDEKILAVALVESIALSSGGDVPISLFMGDIPRPGEHPDQLDDFLPRDPSPYLAQPRTHHSPTYLLLRDGRMDDMSFDLSKSPLALWLYQRVEQETRAALRASADRLFAGDLAPRAFLDQWPAKIRNDVIRACQHLVLSRLPELDALLSECPPGSPFSGPLPEGCTDL